MNFFEDWHTAVEQIVRVLTQCKVFGLAGTDVFELLYFLEQKCEVGVHISVYVFDFILDFYFYVFGLVLLDHRSPLPEGLDLCKVLEEGDLAQILVLLQDSSILVYAVQRLLSGFSDQNPLTRNCYFFLLLLLLGLVRTVDVEVSTRRCYFF